MKCKYLIKCNNDDADDEEEQYDYYSCKYMNELQAQKHGYYSSKENEVIEEECKYFKCDTCAFTEYFN
mgnify:CR=1 FL=1